MGYYWTKKEVEYLRQNYSDTGNKILAQRIGRTKNAIEGKAQGLDLEKSKEFMKQMRLRVLEKARKALENRQGIYPSHITRTNREGYAHYRSDARRRGIDFELSIKEWGQFQGSSCYYCGGTLDKIALDRIDNNKGYTSDNVVPCCKTCNYMKRGLSVSDFIKHCKKIAKLTLRI